MEKFGLSRLQRNFSTYLKEYRKTHQMTQGDLAQRLGCAISRVGLFESSSTDNKVISSLETLRKFAKLQNLSLSEFVGILETTKPTQEALWQTKAMNVMKKLSPQSQKDLAELISETSVLGLPKLFRLTRLAKKSGMLDAIDNLNTAKD